MKGMREEDRRGEMANRNEKEEREEGMSIVEVLLSIQNIDGKEKICSRKFPG